LAEMAFAGRCGMEVVFTDIDPFVPVICGYILQVADNKAGIFSSIDNTDGLMVRRVGVPCADRVLRWKQSDGITEQVKLDELSDSWRSTLNW